tara:strand:- start:1176 stop:2342 length:1167 start_codon:yes stop_codon:yes gene_type:complete
MAAITSLEKSMDKSFYKTLNEIKSECQSDVIVKEINDYILMKYKKKSLTIDNEKTLGLFRSIIVKDDNLVCFAPQKAINFNNFIVDNNFDDCEITEFIPGTMVNIFYDETSDEEIKWQICTRSNIGARCRYNLDTQKTFRDMFFEAAVNSDFIWDNLNKDCCYSFVLEHPENTNLSNVSDATITLTHVYKILNNNIQDITNEINIDNVNKPRSIKELHPDVNDWLGLVELCADKDYNMNEAGFVIKNKNKQRTKILNISFLSAKSLNGNSQKLQYNYYKLRNNNKIYEYINYFPHHIELFNKFQENLYEWTEQLFSYYVDCFIVKKIRLKDAPYEFKPILYELQSTYLNDLKPNNRKVTFTFLTNYVKTIPIPKLMFSINYKNKPQKN